MSRSQTAVRCRPRDAQRALLRWLADESVLAAVVMSAVRQEGAAGEESKADGAAAASSGETRVVRYRQEQGIPSYLIAMAVGNLVSREIGPRSKCWSEPETVDAGAYEFADTEKFLSIAEELLTPYAWGVYDVLLLPPSFPYGGMENPCLTFVTPTLLAGDRSLGTLLELQSSDSTAFLTLIVTTNASVLFCVLVADVICHEIAHSWTGNLVTSRYWSDFWLNEGFTMLVQRKVMMRILGAPFFDFDGAKGLHDLREDLAHFGAENPLTALRPAIDGIDPDDAFSSVPYEKGFSFLVYLQNTVGGHEAMDGFLKAYITKFAGKSITSDDFRAFFCEHFSEVDLAAVDWETWFSTPGMPPCELPYDTSMRDACDALAAKWLECQGAGIGAESFEALNVHQRIAFLDQLLTLTATDDTGASPGARLSHDALEKLDAVYGLGKSGNSEIRFRWLTLGLRHGYGKVVDNTVQFLAEQGRMKVRVSSTELMSFGQFSLLTLLCAMPSSCARCTAPSPKPALLGVTPQRLPAPRSPVCDLPTTRSLQK